MKFSKFLLWPSLLSSLMAGGCDLEEDPSQDQFDSADDGDDLDERNLDLNQYCVAYVDKNMNGASFTFYPPRDYNDLHRKPNFGDRISSIMCVGVDLEVYEHTQWNGNMRKIVAGKPEPDLHIYGIGDKISSVRWAEDVPAGSCTLYEHKSWQGAALPVQSPFDYNDLHRMGWGDRISSYRCKDTKIRLCANDQWVGCSPLLAGEDADIHDNGYGDNASSILW